MLREEEDSGAPPRAQIDLVNGVALISRLPAGQDGRSGSTEGRPPAGELDGAPEADTAQHEPRRRNA